MGLTFDPLSYGPLYLDSGKVILARGANHVEGGIRAGSCVY